MFTTESIVAKTWANAVLKGEKSIEEVPNLSNLIDVVNQIIEGVDEDVY